VLVLLTIFNPYVVAELFTARQWVRPGRSTVVYLACYSVLAIMALLLWRRETRRAPARHVQLLFPAAAVVMLLAVAGIAGELLLRAMPTRSDLPSSVVPKSYIYGWALAPHQKAHMENPDTGERWVETLNSEGWRDVEHGQVASEPRVLLLGDSQLFGKGVKFEETVGRQLQRELSNAVEVISISSGGWSTDQQYVALEKEGFAYQPTVVVVLATLANDVTGNYMREEEFAGASKPYFTLDDGKLELHYLDRRPSALRVAGDKSLLVRHLRYGIAMLRLLTSTREQHKRPEYLYVNWPMFSPEKADELQKAWDVTEAILGRLRDECASRGVQLLVYAYGQPPDDAPVLPMKPGRADSRMLDPNLPYRKFYEIATRQNLSVPREPEPLRARFASGELKFVKDVHLNADGCRELAVVLADHIRPMLAETTATAGASTPQ
jgi:hypothetical protein